ncbi:uncharacterized protein PHACADRAFT_248795 [Phanerochaete carnosa HHB-10118-sp]|uniref:Uncharacterized protein n=1 Tax=Phanerochaete carnosa (strain HHB-10118-sp) TaxID=650164 RepID=K5XFN6_PHACS|nr:uncharacterized protein PHACADRAFT_248795 [Phanerochaete carnosa HHB-10118-sp]EKM61892.1 hypothetical protein PHACADRAFT_248795 [Phanerochaete carnosa HHB-10118-sp]
MAITKWIPAFGAAPSTSTTTSPAQPEEAIPVTAAADAKQFGLENFGNTWCAHLSISPLQLDYAPGSCCSQWIRARYLW